MIDTEYMADSRMEIRCQESTSQYRTAYEEIIVCNSRVKDDDTCSVPRFEDFVNGIKSLNKA